jgi:uncharacterized membrane protein
VRRALLGLTILAQVLSPKAPERPATAGIVGLMTALSVTAPRGRSRSALAAAAGVASEVAGVRTGRPFGPYHYTSKLGPGVAGVPFAVGACWAMMAGPSWAVAVASTERRALRPLVAAGAMTAWDVALDPRMVREGYWVWARPGRYEGIPLSNFAGWLVVGGALFGVWSLVDPEPAPDDEGLALYAWSWVGEVVANLVFWRRPRVAAAAGAAMGAFAVPAVRRRLGDGVGHVFP